MGGLGSGRASCTGGKGLADRCRRIEVSYLRRRGMFAMPAGVRSMELVWTRRGRPTGSAWVDVLGRDQLHIRYDRDGRRVIQPVALDWTRCHYGGERPWLRCPACDRRVAVLYQGDGPFACRSCYGLAYRSQRKDRASRLQARAQAIRQRLGGSGALVGDYPRRPRGMHWSTYARLCERGEAIELAMWLALVSDTAEALRKIGQRMTPPAGA